MQTPRSRPVLQSPAGGATGDLSSGDVGLISSLLDLRKPSRIPVAVSDFCLRCTTDWLCVGVTGLQRAESQLSRFHCWLDHGRVAP